jgi:hypothetical protein
MRLTCFRTLETAQAMLWLSLSFWSTFTVAEGQINPVRDTAAPIVDLGYASYRGSFRNDIK